MTIYAFTWKIVHRKPRKINKVRIKNWKLLLRGKLEVCARVPYVRVFPQALDSGSAGCNLMVPLNSQLTNWSSSSAFLWELWITPITFTSVFILCYFVGRSMGLLLEATGSAWSPDVTITKRRSQWQDLRRRVASCVPTRGFVHKASGSSCDSLVKAGKWSAVEDEQLRK